MTSTIIHTGNKQLGNQRDDSDVHLPATTVHFNIPSEDLSTRDLINLLRLFEILCCFRAISPGGHLSSKWHGQFRSFLQETGQALGNGARLASEQNLMSQNGARSVLFETWIQTILHGRKLFPIESIEKGSVEVVMAAANLASIFYLQENGMLKDTIQWASDALLKLIGRHKTSKEADLDGDLLPKTPEPALITPETIRSGTSAAISITPEFIRAVQAFDDVEFTAESEDGVHRLRLKLKKHLVQNEPTA